MIKIPERVFTDMLELKNLCFGVESEDSTKEIIRDVSLEIADGSFVVITGPNGGGKTTLAKLIMGLEAPSSGQILLDGEDVTALSVTEHAKKGISYGFQQPPRFKGMTVYDLLKIASGRDMTAGMPAEAKTGRDAEGAGGASRCQEAREACASEAGTGTAGEEASSSAS